MVGARGRAALNKNRFDTILDYIIKWCICAIIFAAPFSKSISEISIVIAITAWVSKKIINRDFRLEAGDLNIHFLIFVIAFMPSFLNSSLPLLSLKALFTKVLKYVFLYFVIAESINTKSKLKDLFSIALLSIAVILLDGFGQYFYSGVDGLHNYPSFKMRTADNLKEGFFRGFPTACFPFPNDLAAWILLAIFPVACFTIFDIRKNRAKFLTGFLSLGLFYLLFLTKTRAAWIGLTISTFYLALAKKKIWLILLLVLALAIPFLLKMEMAQYIFGVSSVTDRIDMWRVGWKIFMDHPVVGNGINTFFGRYMEYRTDQWQGQKGSYAHNCYLQMAADVGVLGLLGFLFLIASHFFSVARNMRYIRDPLYANVLLGISAGVFAFLILAFFDTNLYSLNLVTLFWCAIGISQAIIRVCRERAV